MEESLLEFNWELSIFKIIYMYVCVYAYMYTYNPNRIISACSHIIKLIRWSGDGYQTISPFWFDIFRQILFSMEGKPRNKRRFKLNF